MPVSQGNIGHCDAALFNAISNLNRIEEGTENPRVGGSIPPLATIKIKLLAKNDTDVNRLIIVRDCLSISRFIDAARIAYA